MVTDFHDDFAGPVLDGNRWVAHYLPHWTTPDRSAARYDLGPGGLRLRIDADQPDWRPEDAPLRVSNLQTGVFSATPERLLWAPAAGRVDVRVSASRDEGCMLAVWLVGAEHRDERDSGEICVFEIDASAIGAASTTVRCGVKAHHDDRLRTEMAEVVVPLDASRPHTWTAEWGPDGTVISCAGERVWHSPQAPSYPLLLMIDLFELGGPSPAHRYPKTALVHSVTCSVPR